MGELICGECLNAVWIQKKMICPMCAQGSVGGMVHGRCVRAWGMDGLWAGFGYRGVMRQLVQRMKFRYETTLVDTIVDMWISMGEWPGMGREAYTVVPVPLHARRLRWRGFNQAALMGESLARAFGYGYVDCLERIRYTRPQSELRRAERLENLRGAFGLRDGCEVDGWQVLLVDDVWTTGATMRACTQVLKRKGAVSVWGAVVAR